MAIVDFTAIVDNGILSGLNYRGTWDANANNPILGDNGVGGFQGDYFIVGTAGATSIDGETDWEIGDWIVNNGDNWQKIDNSEVTVVHNTLPDLQGGIVGQYYHFTSAQHTALLPYVTGGLDAAYDINRQILVDSGAVELVVSSGQLTAFYIDQQTNPVTANKCLIDIDADLQLPMNRFFMLADIDLDETVASGGNSLIEGINMSFTSASGSGKFAYYGFRLGVSGVFDSYDDCEILRVVSSSTFGDVHSYYRGIISDASGMTLNSYEYAYGVHVKMPDDLTPTNNPLYGVFVEMPASYSGSNMMAVKFTGDGRTVEICNTGSGIFIPSLPNMSTAETQHGVYVHSTATMAHANACLIGHEIDLDGMTISSYSDIIGLKIDMPDDKPIGSVNNPIYGIKVTMPVSYSGTGLSGVVITGNSRSVAVCNTDEAMKLIGNNRTVLICDSNDACKITDTQNIFGSMINTMMDMTSTITLNDANAEYRGIKITMTGMTLTNYNELYGIEILMGALSDDSACAIRCVADNRSANICKGNMAGYFSDGTHEVNLADDTYAILTNDGGECFFGGQVEINDAENKPLLLLDQDHTSSEFIKFEGNEQADVSGNISTVNGNATVTGPKQQDDGSKWTYAKCVKVDVGGTEYWIPVYIYSP